MPELATPWEGFDELLDRVEARDETGHPGWEAMAETLRSYRLWKSGARDRARRIADGTKGPLGEAMTAWYDELTRRTGISPTRLTATGTR
ncbi:hypothetical protein [Streptomyces sp. H27-D2]|uniref:hypothetical protein n=1 Tax=Streptomyces sp. H27-D2 TaxID=3046304 RepID=UPI002DBF4AE6|nr:hypothetical protein [Streptomyces sp. H27-D2]MEC4020480.1 hypothetical protein [Streptomyces sp. H27-D2]